jgi:hypothetical protein
MSNSRNVALSAALEPTDPRASGSVSRGSVSRCSDSRCNDSRGNVILSAAARKVIAQHVACVPELPRPAASTGVVCTASMP